MPRKPDERINQAKEMYLKGMKLVEIANRLNLPEGTIRSWKNRYEWDCNVAKNYCNVAKKKKGKKKAAGEDVDQVMGNPELTDKQRLFCLHYVRCFNATKAAVKAGYSRETASEQGYQLLQKTSVRDEIAKLKQNRLNREMIDASDIFQKYLDIAFADITEYVEFGREEVPVMGAFGPVKVEDPETGEKVTMTKMVNTIRFRESADVDGTLISEVRQGKDGASVKLKDSMKALDWLSSHMGMATEEQRAKVEYLKARTEILKSQKASEETGGSLAEAIEEAYRNGHSEESD